MRLQVRIAQLNDARLLLMSREEERAERLGQPSPFGQLHGGEIVVRDPAKMMPKPKAEALPAPKPKQLPNVPQTPYVPPAGHERLGLPSVVALLEAEGAMTRPEIARRLGVAGGDEAVKLTKTLSNMRQHGYVRKDAEQRFVPQKKRKVKGSRTVTKPDPERAARERQAVLDVLSRATEPMPSGDVIAAVMGPGKKQKTARDRLYWALKALRDSGAVNFRDGLYRLVPKAA